VVLSTQDDYDLTHTFYYVGNPSGPRRSIASTTQLTIIGVELTGVSVLGRPKASLFVEEIEFVCNRSLVATAYTFSDINHWLSLAPSRRCYVSGCQLSLEKDGDEKLLTSLRVDYGLQLTTPRSVWVGYLGMDWPEHFFGRGCDGKSPNW